MLLTGGKYAGMCATYSGASARGTLCCRTKARRLAVGRCTSSVTPCSDGYEWCHRSMCGHGLLIRWPHITPPGCMLHRTMASPDPVYERTPVVRASVHVLDVGWRCLSRADTPVIPATGHTRPWSHILTKRLVEKWCHTYSEMQLNVSTSWIWVADGVYWKQGPRHAL